MANGVSSLSTTANTTVNYQWSETNADTFSSTITSISPGGHDNCGNTQGSAWAANSSGPGTSTPIGTCAAGFTYTFTYYARLASTGQQASASVVVVVAPLPTAHLTANGATSISVAANTNITYQWSSTNADTFSSTITSISPGGHDNCVNTQGGSWLAYTANSSPNPTYAVVPCQVGFTYTIVYYAKQTGSGVTASAPLTISVH